MCLHSISTDSLCIIAGVHVLAVFPVVSLHSCSVLLSPWETCSFHICVYCLPCRCTVINISSASKIVCSMALLHFVSQLLGLLAV